MKARQINPQYNVVVPGSLPDKVAAFMRKKMYERFLSSSLDRSSTILEVGATSDQSQIASNYLVKWYPHKAKITACGIDDASFLEESYPGVKFVRADGRCLPFPTESFDFVHSSAVLEHVGTDLEQRKFVSELYRVSRKGVFLTTPNRWFPIEFHSALPLLHWLPKAAFRSVLRRIGHSDLALERNLNLLGVRDLRRICTDLELEKFEIESVSLGCWPSNLILMLSKPSTPALPRPISYPRMLPGDPATPRKRATLLRYVVSGGCAALVYMATVALAHRALSFGLLSSGALGYVASLPCAFLLHRHFSFPSQRPTHEEIGQFLAASIVGGVLCSFLPELLAPHFMPLLAALMTTSIVVPAINYFILSLWVFRRE